MTTLVERLRKFCVCFNTTCIGCEAASRIEAQEDTIKKLREALDDIAAYGDSNPGYGHTCAKKARAALADTGSKI